MMGKLGFMEAIEDGSSFSWDVTRPVLPGTSLSVSGVTPRRAPLANAEDRLTALIEARVVESLDVARRQVEKNMSSTSLAALAHALETSGDRGAAVDTALETLRLCQEIARGHDTDTFAARLAMEILLRSGRLESVLEYARSLPISAHLKLEIGAVLAGKSRFEEACAFIEGVSVPERESIEGYILALKGDYQAATPHLRAALRQNPNDADSALNLSISLLGLGARKKARAAAEQARGVGRGRADVWLHLLELVLADGEIGRAEREIDALVRQGVEPSARLLVIQARVQLARKNVALAIRTLEHAGRQAADDGDSETVAEVTSNLLRIRAVNDKISREDALAGLTRLLEEHPQSEVVVVNLAQLVWRRRHADLLRPAFESVYDQLSEANAAFISFQLATLEGDNAVAAEHAMRWRELDPSSDHALAALLIALGIGEERWEKAAVFAQQILSKGNHDSIALNNVAYVLAMAGMGKQAVRILEPHADESYILKATLGLAHLAAGDIAVGMRLYRQAADEAEARHDDSRSLMTAYQALIVRQLGLRKGDDDRMISALSLPPYPLPDDWDDRPEFLRLYTVAQRNGYEWPLEL